MTTAAALPVASRHRWSLFLAEERGASAIEYALLASLVAVLAIGGLVALANGTGDLFTATSEALRNVTSR